MDPEETTITRLWINPECWSDTRPCMHEIQVEFSQGDPAAITKLENMNEIRNLVQRAAEDGCQVTGCSMSHFAENIVNGRDEKPFRVKIEGGCYESFPCQHFVTVVNDDGTRTRRRMNAVAIVDLVDKIENKEDELIITGGVTLDHFAYIRSLATAEEAGGVEEVEGTEEAEEAEDVEEAEEDRRQSKSKSKKKERGFNAAWKRFFG